MTYTSVLVHVEPDPKAAPRVEAAVDVARDFGARLIGLGAEMTQSAGLVDPYGMVGGEWHTVFREQVMSDLAAAEAVFRDKVGDFGAEWRSVQGFPGLAVSQAASSADLVVTGGKPLGRGDQHVSAAIGELILTCGRPVLVAPPAGGALSAEAVVVGWKDTRESRRAVADALPFLKRAKAVVVLGLYETDDDAEAVRAGCADVVDWMKRHGVAAKAKARVAHGYHTTLEIEAEADAIGADLIVVGGYGHSRLGEWAFGGVTDDLLAQPQRFVLFSH